MRTQTYGQKDLNGRRWRFGVAMCVALGMIVTVRMALPGKALATQTAVLTVMNLDDSGVGSLRAAITTANGDPGKPYKIVFASGLSGTITLESTLPAIENALTIDGGGDITISGGYDSSTGTGGVRVMKVTSWSLELDNLTIKNGHSDIGGGIYNSATLTINKSTFSGNYARRYGGAIANYGTLTVTENSTFSGNGTSPSSNEKGGGGGIYNQGTLTVKYSTFSGNSAVSNGYLVHPLDGGGIYNSGTLTVNHSTFSGNSAVGNGDETGGAIADYGGTMTVANSTFSDNTNNGWGGGISIHETGIVTITDSTFAGNSASVGGGIANIDNGKVTIANSTFSRNSATESGGAIFGHAILKGTILARTSADAGHNCGDLVTDNGYNISSDGSCYFSSATSANHTDPLLAGGLASNGGPTLTIALDPDSPAIDAIPVSDCPATDQRDYIRPDDGESTCDIGAYESGAIGGGKLAIGGSKFDLNATIGFDGPIDPLTQNVALEIGASYSSTIPAGSFVQDSQGAYVFQGKIGGVSLQVRVDPAANTLQAEGSGADLSGLITNPVAVTLTIGTVTGYTAVIADIS